MQEIAIMYSAGQYDRILEQYLKESQFINHGCDEKKRRRDEELLYYLFGACAAKGFYLDCLDVLKKLHQLRPIIPEEWSDECLVFFSNAALEAVLYCLVNEKIDNINLPFDPATEAEKIICFQRELFNRSSCTNSERRKELESVYEEYKSGRLPIYTVEFLYPFDPIVPDYTFDISQCFPYITFEVRREKRNTDSLTNFKFTAYGLINPRMDWEGPRWAERRRFPVVEKALAIVNLMLLHAVKASPGKMITPYCVEQVSTVSMFQYCDNGKRSILGGLITGTDFGAHWIGNNSKWHEFSEEEMKELNHRIVRTYDSKPFVRVFHHATNLLSAGFYNESFLLLCFCCEGMFYHQCTELAKAAGIEKEYIEFSSREKSQCDECEYNQGNSKKKEERKMVPSLNQNLAFLQQKNCLTTQTKNEINKLIGIVRNNNLRNAIVHGSGFGAKRQDAERSLQALLDMQEIFIKTVSAKKEAIE